MLHDRANNHLIIKEMNATQALYKNPFCTMISCAQSTGGMSFPFYFILAAPLIVWITHTALLSLAGRLTLLKEDTIIPRTARSVYFLENTYSSVAAFRSSDTRKEFFIQHAQRVSFIKLIDELGGWASFDQSIQSAKDNTLSLFLEFPIDITAVRYALLPLQELRSLKLKDLVPPLTCTQARVLKSRISSLPNEEALVVCHSHLLDNKISDLPSLALSKKQLWDLVDAIGAPLFQLLSEERIQQLIQSTEDPSLSLEECARVFFLSGLETKFFHLLPCEKAADLMQVFPKMSKNRLSLKQEQHYFSHLQAHLLEEEHYEILFGIKEHSMQAKQRRFGLLSQNQATTLMQRFQGRPKKLLNPEQELFFFSHLPADQVTLELYQEVFGTRERCIQTKRKRFALLPLATSAALMHTFQRNPKALVTKEQLAYYLGNLQTHEIDQELYEDFFGSGEYTDIARQRNFSLLSHEVASFVMSMSNGSFKHLLNEEQAVYYYGKLEASQVSDELYATLFGEQEHNTDSKRKRFSLLPHTTVYALMQNFHGAPKDLLSEEQSVYYYGKLEASQVSDGLYATLFGAREYNTNSKRERFALLSPQTVAALMNRFPGPSKYLLTQEQSDHYFGQLQASDIDEDLYKVLFGTREASLEARKKRFSLLTPSEAKLLIQKFFPMTKDIA